MQSDQMVETSKHGAQIRVMLSTRDQHGRRNSTEEDETMKEYHCGSLVPGCDWHTRHEEEAEIIRRAVEHMREVHGETIIRETMVEAIRSRIQTVRQAA
jgi:predicted small metal-binding protein